MKSVKKYYIIFLLVSFVCSGIDADSYIKIRLNDKYGLLNEKKNLLCECEYSNIFFLNEYVFCNAKDYIDIYNKNNKRIDRIYPGEVGFFTSISFINKENYVFHGFFNDYIYNLETKQKKIAGKISINKSNSEISSLLPIYSSGVYYSVDEGKKFKDKNFEKVYPFVNGVAVVLKDDWKKAIINENGDFIMEDIINCGWQYQDGLLPVITEKKSGYINEKGIFQFYCDIMNENKNDNVGGNPTLTCSFSEGYAYVHNSDKTWMILDKNWNIVKQNLPYSTDSNSYFSNGLLCVNYSGKYGFLSEKGIIKFPCIFEYAENFCNGYTCVVYENQDAILDKDGNLYLVKDLLSGKDRKYKNVLKL